MDREQQTLNDLLDSIKTDTVRKDLVYTLLVRAWDIGFCDGWEEAREERRRNAEY
jgi:hypothetical protein